MTAATSAAPSCPLLHPLAPGRMLRSAQNAPVCPKQGKSWARASDPCLATLVGALVDPKDGRLSAVTQYAPYGSLEELLPKLVPEDATVRAGWVAGGRRPADAWWLGCLGGAGQQPLGV